MQDIATALKTAINQWEIVSKNNEEHIQLSGAVPTAKQPVAHTIFNYVRDNPGMTAPQYTEKLSEKGLIRGSVSSYIYQMMSYNLLYADADKKLYTKHKEYKTIKQLPKQAKPPTQRKAKQAPAPKPAATPAPVPATRSTAQQEVENILSTLNIRTARLLLENLTDIFDR
jgi:hypothetical protein